MIGDWLLLPLCTFIVGIIILVTAYRIPKGKLKIGGEIWLAVGIAVITGGSLKYDIIFDAPIYLAFVSAGILSASFGGIMKIMGEKLGNKELIEEIQKRKKHISTTP